MTAEDFAVEIAQDEPRHRTIGAAHDWLQAIKGLTKSQCWQILDSFGATAANVSPNDFGRAKRRMFPSDVCPICSGTGMTGDVGMDRSEPCECPEGERMAQLRSGMAPSVLSTGKHLTPEAREYGLAMVAYLRDQNPYLNRTRRAS